MYTQSQTLQQLCDERISLMTQLRRKRKEELTTKKRNIDYNLETWLNVDEFKTYVTTNYNDELYQQLITESYMENNYNSVMYFIFIHKNNTIKKYSLTVFEKTEFNDQIDKFDFNDLSFIIGVYNFKFKLIFDVDEFINVGKSMLILLTERYESYQKLTYDSNTTKNKSNYSREIINRIVEDLMELFNIEIYKTEPILALKNYRKYMNNRLYFIDEFGKVRSFSINNISLNELIEFYKSRKPAIVAIHFNYEELFFDNLDSLLFGLNYINKYCSSLNELKLD